MKRSFHGNYQGGHVQKAKLRKQIHTPIPPQDAGTGPPGWGSLHSGHGLPSDPSPNLEPGNPGPARGDHTKETKEVETEATFMGRRLSSQAPTSGGWQQGPARAHFSSAAAPTLGCFLYQPPLVRARGERQSQGCSSNCPRKPSKTQWGRPCQGQPCWGRGLGVREGVGGD